MGNEGEVHTLEGVLDEVAAATVGQETITMEAAFYAVGRRSFGPILLVPGVIALSPLSGIPGMPTLVGLMVLLITSQLLWGRSEFWLPQFVLRRSVSRKRFDQAMRIMKRVARLTDRCIRPRLSVLVKGPAMYVIATLCLLMSLAAPLLELLPFVITGVGGAVTAFGLALLADDGLLSLLAAIVCVGTGIAAVMLAL